MFLDAYDVMRQKSERDVTVTTLSVISSVLPRGRGEAMLNRTRLLMAAVGCVFVLLAANAHFAFAECKVESKMDPEVAARLAVLLSGTTACQGHEITVTRVELGYKVVLVHRGRYRERVASTLASAAAWIDSWLVSVQVESPRKPTTTVATDEGEQKTRQLLQRPIVSVVKPPLVGSRDRRGSAKSPPPPRRQTAMAGTVEGGVISQGNLYRVLGVRLVGYLGPAAIGIGLRAIETIDWVRTQSGWRLRAAVGYRIDRRDWCVEPSIGASRTVLFGLDPSLEPDGPDDNGDPTVVGMTVYALSPAVAVIRRLSDHVALEMQLSASYTLSRSEHDLVQPYDLPGVIHPEIGAIGFGATLGLRMEM